MTIQITKIARNIKGKFVEYIYSFYEPSGGTGGTLLVPLKRIVGYSITGEKDDLSATLGAALRKTVDYDGTITTFAIAYSDPAPKNSVGTISIVGTE